MEGYALYHKPTKKGSPLGEPSSRMIRGSSLSSALIPNYYTRIRAVIKYKRNES